MSALEEFRHHADELAGVTGVRVRLVEAGMQLYAVLDKVPLPTGAYRVDATDALFITDQQYPLSAMDMFWTELGVLRPDGSVPAGADSIETYLERQWRRFSWHRNGVWNPAGNCLLDHFEFMQARFALDVPK